MDSWTRNVRIGDLTYYQIGGVAPLYSQPNSLAELQETLLLCHKHRKAFAVTGTGSNSIFSDEEFPGLLISLQNLCSSYWLDENHLFVECGVTNTELAELALWNGYKDLAWMHRMPGLFGASIRMNARCYGGETSAVVEQVNTLTPEGLPRTYSSQEVFLGYKSTLFMKSPEIVVSAVVRLNQKSDPRDVLDIMESCESDRHKKHHFDFPSCGSTFKNNYEVGKSSGQIFDELGLKGQRRGACVVSPYHGNFVFHEGGGNASEMLGLAELMKGSALAKGMDLQLEVQPMGAFAKDLAMTLDMPLLAPVYERKSRPNSILSGFLSPEKNSDWELVSTRGEKHRDLVTSSQGPSKNSQGSSINSRGTSFPKLLAAGCPEDYFRREGRHLGGVELRLEQLRPLEQARQNPTLDFLRFEVVLSSQTRAKLFSIAPPELGVFQDNLWLCSVAEVFFAHRKTGEYFEFEVTPDGSWIAIAFDGPRIRKPDHQVPQEGLWPGVRAFGVDSMPFEADPQPIREDGVASKSAPQEKLLKFGLVFNYASLSSLLDKEGFLSAQTFVSLGNRQHFLFPHWYRNPKVETHVFGLSSDTFPLDFHQPSLFSNVWIE